MRIPRPAESGQTVVELVALLPALVLIGLVGWQMALAGYAWIVADGAARAGARAAEVGAPPERAALAVLPAGYGPSAHATRDDSAHLLRVRVRVPGVLPLVPSLGSAGAQAPLGDPRRTGAQP